MKDDRALLAGALGTFHVVLLTLLIVVGLYQTIDLGKALADLSTAAGLGIFVVLWAISVYCTNRALRDAGVEPGASMRTGSIVRTGIGWGFWNGMIFFWFLLIGRRRRAAGEVHLRERWRCQRHHRVRGAGLRCRDDPVGSGWRGAWAGVFVAGRGVAGRHAPACAAGFTCCPGASLLTHRNRA